MKTAKNDENLITSGHLRMWEAVSKLYDFDTHTGRFFHFFQE